MSSLSAELFEPPKNVSFMYFFSCLSLPAVESVTRPDALTQTQQTAQENKLLSKKKITGVIQSKVCKINAYIY